MNWIDDWIISIIVLSGIAAISVFFALATWADSATCSAQWEDSNFHYRWGIMQGCMIQLPNGSWVPAQSYRVVAGEK